MVAVPVVAVYRPVKIELGIKITNNKKEKNRNSRSILTWWWSYQHHYDLKMRRFGSDKNSSSGFSQLLSHWRTFCPYFECSLQQAISPLPSPSNLDGGDKTKRMK